MNPSKIPSELLEGPVTEVIGILVHDAVRKGGKKEDWELVKSQLHGLNLFITICGGVHCNLALSHFSYGQLEDILRNDELRAHMNRNLSFDKSS